MDLTSGRVTFYDQPFLSYGNFLEPIVLFLGKINTQIEDFEQFCVTREGFSASKKYKKYNFEYNGYVCLTKAKVRGLALFIRNNQI